MFNQYITRGDYLGLTQLKHKYQDDIDYFEWLLMRQLGEQEISELLELEDYHINVIREIQNSQLKILELTK